MFATYRGMAVVIDDLLPKVAGDYTTVLFTPGAVGWGLTAPRVADGTEIENKPGAGNGGGQYSPSLAAAMRDRTLATEADLVFSPSTILSVS